MDIRTLGVNYYNFFLFALAFLSPIILFLFASSKRKPQLPPGPFAWPVIGNIFSLDSKQPHISLCNLAESYGPLISLRFGARQVVVASSPEAAREIFKIHDRVLSGRYIPKVVNALPEVYSSSVAVAAECNERWRFLRRTSHTELFSVKALNSCSRIRLEKAKEMINFLCMKEGEAVHIDDILLATNANIVSNAMLSQDIIDESWKNIGEVKSYIRRIVEIGIPGLADLYPALEGLDYSIKQKTVDYLEINRAIWGDILRKRRGRQEVAVSNKDIVDILIENSFDDDQIRNFLTENLVSAGTVSKGIEWAMAELIRNKVAFSKLRDELIKETEGTALSESHLERMPYLQACIKETLRMHPPSPLLVPRCALKACEVMNYKIPKSCLVIVNVYALGRDSKTWDDPQSFIPERFLGKNVDVKGSNYELLPFGGGRRICTGYPLALKQMQLLLASLVNAFDWFLPPGSDQTATNLDMSEKFCMTLARERPLVLIPKLRNDVQKYWV